MLPGAVLAVSGILEGYSLYVAASYVLEGARARGMTFLQYVRSGVDPTTVAVMLEDGGAVAGLAIAGAPACVWGALAAPAGSWGREGRQGRGRGPGSGHLLYSSRSCACAGRVWVGWAQACAPR